MYSYPKPMTRDNIHARREQLAEEQRNRMIKKAEAERQRKVQNAVLDIYSHAVETINLTNEDRCLYIIDDGEEEFYKKNLTDILAKIESIFPDCSVKHKLEKHNNHIIIDWS